jgi:hypothetical protein
VLSPALVQVTAEEERALQASSVSSFYGTITVRILTGLLYSLVAGEGIKVLLITVVSPQFLPRVSVLRGTKLREAVRLLLKGLVGCVYFTLRMF